MAHSLVLFKPIPSLCHTTALPRRKAVARSRMLCTVRLGDFGALPVPESATTPVPRICNLVDFHDSSTGDAADHPGAVKVVDDGKGKELADLLMATVEASAQVEDFETLSGRMAMVALTVALGVEFITGHGIFSSVDPATVAKLSFLGLVSTAAAGAYAYAWRAKRHVADVLSRGCLHWMDRAVDHIIDAVFSEGGIRVHQAPRSLSEKGEVKPLSAVRIQPGARRLSRQQHILS